MAPPCFSRQAGPCPRACVYSMDSSSDVALPKDMPILKAIASAHSPIPVFFLTLTTTVHGVLHTPCCPHQQSTP